MNWNRFLISLIVLLITLGSVVYISGRPLPKVVEKKLNSLPYAIGPWEGKDFSFDRLVIDELDTDDRISRNYIHKNNGYLITLYIGYYGTKKGGRTGHNPNACYPSSGWEIVSDTANSITEDYDEVNRMLVQKGSVSQIVYHWYQDEDKIIQSGIEQNINRFINKLRYNRDDGAFVRISIDGINEGSEAALKQFGNLLIPLISENWPIEE